MDEASAAEIFDEMVRTDLDLVVNILKGISNSDHRAAILSNMSTTAAEQVTRRMAPDALSNVETP